MSVSRQQMMGKLGSIEKPKLIQESDLQSDNILRVISSEGGYRLEVDAFPIDGPFEVSSDEFKEIAKMEEENGDDLEALLDLSEDQLEMVETGCEPGIPCFRYQLDVRAEGPVFDEFGF
jgi:hypothetical protein